MKNKSCIFFQNETEMSFWMGIYQTSLRETPSVSACDEDLWGEPKNAPDRAADQAVRDLRLRMNPPVDRYHNSPQHN